MEQASERVLLFKDWASISDLPLETIATTCRAGRKYAHFVPGPVTLRSAFEEWEEGEEPEVREFRGVVDGVLNVEPMIEAPDWAIELNHAADNFEELWAAMECAYGADQLDPTMPVTFLFFRKVD